MLAAGLIWILAALLAKSNDIHAANVEFAVHQTLWAYGELFLFLLTAMTYINAMTERGVFDALRVILIRKNLSYRSAFWLTGLLSFLISPFADNLTTALLMGSVVIAIGGNNSKFISLAFINIVVAAKRPSRIQYL